MLVVAGVVVGPSSCLDTPFHPLNPFTHPQPQASDPDGRADPDGAAGDVPDARGRGGALGGGRGGGGGGGGPG